MCLSWRREYDRSRDRSIRPWDRPRPAKLGRSPWYVCVDEWSESYSWHDYQNRACSRCGADQTTEELWEERWKVNRP